MQQWIARDLNHISIAYKYVCLSNKIWYGKDLQEKVSLKIRQKKSNCNGH